MPGGLFCAIGNPTSDDTWTYTWEKGRQLKRVQSVDTDAQFVYNENGLRIQKTVNGVVTKYTLHGKNIVHMTQGNDTLHFYYDATNRPAMVEYNGVKYTYIYNLQSDVVALLDSNGTAVVKYRYDAWGKPTSKTGDLASTLGTVQPFRYRAYVFDEEMGMYYLNSRYYNAQLCRFNNCDTLIYELIAIGTHNVYSYCNNNPVFRSDSNGNAWWHWAVGAAVVAVCAVAVVVAGAAVVGAMSTAAVTQGVIAVTSVSCGIAAATPALTITAGAFIGSSSALAVSAIYAGMNSTSFDEFAEYGDWGVIGYTAFGGAYGATIAGIRGYYFKKYNQFGTASPDNRKNQPAANSAYYQLNSEGEGIKSVAYYDDHGRQWYRYDYLGRPHRGVIPHIHKYIYHIGGPIEKIVYDLNWNQIDPPLK